MTKIRKRWKMPGGNRGDRSSRAKAGGWDICSEKGHTLYCSNVLKVTVRTSCINTAILQLHSVQNLFVVNKRII